MRFRTLGVLLAAVAPGLAAAADDPPPPTRWSGEVTAGFIETTGNSETRTANARAEVIYASETWRNTFTAGAIQSQATQTNELTAQEENKVTAERYGVGNKTDFNFTEVDYAFLQLEYEKDLIGGVRERTSETVGYGHKLLTGPAHLLEMEAGVGARQTEEQGTGIEANDAILRGRIGYKWNFSETSFFAEGIKAESGESNTFTESVTELRLSLIGKLFAQASYTIRANTDVPVGTRKTDTITTFSLGWTFGK